MTQAALERPARQLYRRHARRFMLTAMVLSAMLLVSGSASALVGGLPSLPVDASHATSASTPLGSASASYAGGQAEICSDAGARGNDAYGHIDTVRSNVPADLPALPVDVPRPSLPDAAADGCVSVDDALNANADLCAQASGIEKPDLPVSVETPSLPVDTPQIPSGADACASAFHSAGEIGASHESSTADGFVGKLKGIWSKFTGLF